MNPDKMKHLPSQGGVSSISYKEGRQALKPILRGQVT